jgi:hypothetical protein
MPASVARRVEHTMKPEQTTSLEEGKIKRQNVVENQI